MLTEILKKKLHPTFIAVTVCISLYSPNNYAKDNKILKQFQPQNNQRCLVNVPLNNRLSAHKDTNEEPINVVSDNFNAEL